MPWPAGPPLTTATWPSNRRLDRASRLIDIVDEIQGAPSDVRLAFHLGPDVLAELGEGCAMLRWPDAVTPGAAWMELAPQLRWTLHRGETGPILGWYSRGLGQRTPAYTLLGCGHVAPGTPLTSRLQFLDADKPDREFVIPSAVSTAAADSLVRDTRNLRAEAG